MATIIELELTCIVSGACLAATSWQEDRVLTGRFRALVLDVLALHASHDAPLLVHGYALATQAVHDAERRSEVGEPRRSQFPELGSELAFCNQNKQTFGQGSLGDKFMYKGT